MNSRWVKVLKAVEYWATLALCIMIRKTVGIFSPARAARWRGMAVPSYYFGAWRSARRQKIKTQGATHYD